MKMVVKIGAILGLAMPALALAEASNFNYVEAQRFSGDVDDVDVDIDGWGLNGSVEITDKVFVAGSYVAAEPEDDIGIDVDVEALSLGVGYVFGENETGNFFGTLSYDRTEVEASVGSSSESEDDDGYALSLGTRVNLGANGEFRLEVGYADVGGDGSLVTTGSLVYEFFPQFAGLIEYSHESEVQSVGIGVRYYFR